MSYSLEFLTIEFDALRNFFAEGDATIRQEVIDQGAEIYPDSETDEEMREGRFIWDELVTSLSGGNYGKYLAEQTRLGVFSAQNDHASRARSLAVAAIARRFAESIACVTHSSGSGEVFRTEPFEYLKQYGFLGKVDPFLLLERPLFNQLADSLPGWGGLTRDELAGISTDNLANAQSDSGDSDVDMWVNGILSLTEEAKLRGLDLLTLYE